MKPCPWIFVLTSIVASCFSKQNLPDERSRFDQQCHIRYRHSLLNQYDYYDPPRAQNPDAICQHQRCDGKHIANTARRLLATKRLVSGAFDFRRDCSGFVIAALAESGVPIQHILPKRNPGEGGVSMLYRMANDYGRVHHNKRPAVGDLVFFDNTHDRNRNGRLDDPLTHIGIVEAVDADGTVTFIHHVRRGIVRSKLNLYKPHWKRDSRGKKVFNHPLRMKHKVAKLTGELFHSFASISFRITLCLAPKR